MAQITVFVNYVIYFRDAADYTAAVALAGGNAYYHCPQTAASVFGLTFPPAAGPLDPVKGMYNGSTVFSVAPPGTEIGFPNLSGILMDPTVDTVLVPGQAGVPAAIWPPGPDGLHTWVGLIVRAGGAAGANPAPPAAIAQRRWCVGFEYPGRDGMSGIGGDDLFITRDASRVLDGLGYAMRNTTVSISIPINTYDAALTSANSWERFYVRPRVFGATSTQIWNCHGFPTDSSGGRIEVTPAGQLAVYNVAAGTPSLLGTAGSLAIDVWSRIDVLINYNTLGAGGSGRLRVYLNGTLGIDQAIPAASGGLGQNSSRHVRSTVGNEGAANTAEFDIDDWEDMEIPTVLGVESLTSLDWNAGSHVQTLWGTAFGAAHSVNWAGDFRVASQLLNPLAATAGARLTSSTASARSEVVTDHSNDQMAVGSKLGAVAGLVGGYLSEADNTDGALGYRPGGGAIAVTTVNETSSLTSLSAMYRPTGMSLPTDVAPWSVVRDKSSTGTAAVTEALQGTLEYIGTWGREDDPTTTSLRTILLHNAYYPRTPWAITGPPPAAPVHAVGGTYVGNSTGQDINLPAPCHFLWIRPLTGGTGGVRWYGTGLGGHLNITGRPIPDYVVRAWTDTANQSKFSVGGSAADVNATGVTYQYIAFCDPGMRFNLCGAFRHAAAVATFANALIDTGFTPIGAFFQWAALNSLTNSTGLAYKGPGHTGSNGNFLDTAESALATFGAGAITSLTNLHVGGTAQTAYSAWRLVDGTCASSQPMVQMLSYTGNGAGGTRNITLTPTSGRFPLFAMVVPHNAQAFFRDPSHTGANSSNAVGTATSTIAITAGAIDQITVGTTLNANGILYDVFVIPGDTAGWNNGNFYAPPCTAPGSQWPTPPANPIPPASGAACLVNLPV